MAIQGLLPLPIGLEAKDALKIYRKLSEVSSKIGRLDEKFKHSMVGESLIRILSLSESVQSTRIEGTQVTFSDMVEEQDDRNPRWEIIEVMNYQKALLEGFEYIQNGYPISTRLIKNLHHTLMDGGRGTSQASGEFRKIQNFIGPTKKIEDASYIPIPVHEISSHMENWETFINGHPYGKKLPLRHLNADQEIIDEESNPLLKAAIIHAQFESIHPFLDGNGRLGRIIIVLYLIQAKVISKPIFFVSEELERERMRYYDLLNGIRGSQPNWGNWLHFFLNACERMAEKLNRKLDLAENLAIVGMNKCDKDSEKKVWMYTFTDPNTTAAKVSDILGISQNTARTALKSLVEKELIYTDQQSKRNKRYKNYDLIRILN